LGQSLDCNECTDRKERTGSYCEACPHRDEPERTRRPQTRRELDDSIVLL
jgi:hypothetical protein